MTIPSHRRAGFTLFEVAISMLIVSFAVVGVLMVFPMGLRQVEVNRFRVFAAAISCQLVDVFANASFANMEADLEGPNAWDVPTDRRCQAPDLEVRCCTQKNGLMPLPTDIARRIDTDGDEMQRILDEGGHVYYLQARSANSWREDLISTQPPNNLQRLVVGVVGHAQHNAAFSYPMKRWPYYQTVPGPPLIAQHTGRTWLPASGGLGPESKPLCLYGDSYCWQAVADPALAPVSRTFWDYYTNGTKDRLGLYIKEALTYFFQVYGSDAGPHFRAWTGQAWDQLPRPAGGSASLVAVHDSDRSRELPVEEQGRRVLALNYLTHALFALTRWHNLASYADAQSHQDVPGLEDGVPVEGHYGFASPFPLPARLTHTDLVRLVTNCRHEHYHFTAAHPWNWSVPRPYEHATMMDFPLLEADLFREPLGGTITGASATMSGGTRHQGKAWQWRYLAPQAITGLPGEPWPLGRSMTYPTQTRFPRSVEDAESPLAENGPVAPGRTLAESHYTIMHKFSASERCRQLVFWVVDWQSYEDCETAPSAIQDASRYDKAAPGAVANDSFDQQMQIMWGWNGNDFLGGLMDHHVHTFRNPEKSVLFTRDVADRSTGSDVRDVVMPRESSADYGISPEAIRIFSGRHGADRNANGRLDRGPVNRATRLRAVTVGRFNFYDPRVQNAMR